MNTKFFLYARKSTEDEERQIMSIEAQLAELAEHAKRENLEVIEQFIESKSAKKPGREVFNKLIARIKESKEPVGLLAWHPDRLARNSIDGGQIIYLIDTAKLVSLRFPTFWFEPTPQGLFMLQVAFGQSKYYSDNLSQNVKRGIRHKLRRGEWTGRAPLGYVNNPKTRTIEPDGIKAKILKIGFEEFAQGKHNLRTLGERLQSLGMINRKGNTLTKSTLQRTLTNPAYIGLITYNRETYEGKFEPLISPATFEAVQKVLKDDSKPRKTKNGHDFPFVGLLRCGECNAAITAQYAHGHGGTYRYYRCTKRLGTCGQSYLREDLMADQLKDELQKVALSPEWTDKMSAQVGVWEKEQNLSAKSFAQNLASEIKSIELKLDKLVSAFLDGVIERETYLQKKDQLIKAKLTLQQKKADFGQKGNFWIEPLREWIKTSELAAKLASSEDLHQIKSLVEKIGTNRRLLNKKIALEFKRPFELILRYKNIYEKRAAEKIDSKNSQNSAENLKSFNWSKLLYHVRTYFEQTTSSSL